MRFAKRLLLATLAACSLQSACAPVARPAVSAETYFGFDAPGTEPELFAAGLVSVPNRHEFGSVFNADGSTIYFAVDHGKFSEIYEITRTAGRYSEARRVVVCAQFSANDPMLSPDESRLYFISNAQGHYDIGFVERLDSGRWSEPRFEPAPINSAKDEFYISFTREGAMVFASDRAATRRGNFDIYRAQRHNGGFGQPVPYPAEINTRGYEADAFIDPRGRYLIFSSNRRGGLGRGDLYISFRSNESWTTAVPIGAPINSPGHELCPFVTNDERFLFYTSNGDIKWVSAEVIRQVPGAISSP